MRQRKRATAIDLRQTLNVLLAARKGDFSARLPPDYEGLAGKVADALNDVIGQNEALAAELQRLSTVVGKEGRTTHRAALPGAAGQWAGLTATGVAGPTACRLEIVGAGGLGGCARSWRGWVVGSSWVGRQHLVITGSPRPLTSDAKLVNGPAWYPKARVRTLGRTTIGDWRMRIVFVPAATNDGSAFSSHVVLIWTVAGHTYGIGFHDVAGLESTVRLDEQLARGIELVRP